MENLIHQLPWIGAVLALVGAFLFHRRVMAASPGNERMQELARAIQEGAMAFLKTEYRVLSLFVVAVAVGLWFLGEDKGGGIQTVIAFLCGAFASALAGWVGMHTATRAAVRTTQAARTGLAPALTIAFSSGTVMGLTVVGLGVLGIAFFHEAMNFSLKNLLGFSFGASSIEPLRGYGVKKRLG